VYLHGLRGLIKSVTEDGLGQVRDIFEVNSLDFFLLLVFFVIEYSQIMNTPIYNSHKISPDTSTCSWKIT
jgi:hypothetical protein